MKLAEERERMFRYSIPKYTLVAPASMAAAKLSQHPTGAMISMSDIRFMLQNYYFYSNYAKKSGFLGKKFAYLRFL